MDRLTACAHTVELKGMSYRGKQEGAAVIGKERPIYKAASCMCCPPRAATGLLCSIVEKAGLQEVRACYRMSPV